MVSNKRLLILGSALLAWVIGGHGQAAAESAADFYKGNKVTVLGGYSPDATFSVFSRITAQYMERYTGAQFAFRALPGAGGTKARNTLYRTKPDGLTIFLADHGAKFIVNALFKKKGIKYDWKKFVPLGKVIAASGIVLVNKKSNWKTPKDLKNVSFDYAESSPFFGPLYAEALGWNKMKFIPGYSGGDKIAAIARGEVQAGMLGANALQANREVILGLVTPRVEPDFPDLPLLKDYVVPGKEKWADLINSWNDVLNFAVAPPGTPADRAAFLEGALHKVWADKDFHASLNKVKSHVSGEFISATRIKQIMTSLAKLSPADIKEMKHVILAKYKK